MFTHELSEGETPSEDVIKTIATLEDGDPTALDPRLYSVIDPDHLDKLFRPIGPATPDHGYENGVWMVVDFILDGTLIGR